MTLCRGLSAVAAVLVLLCCNQDDAILRAPTGPSDVTTPTTTVPPLSLRVDQPFDWNDYRGISEFALFAHTDEEVDSIVRMNVTHGWTHQRVCAELAFWDGTYPYLQVPRDLSKILHRLDVIARIPGAYVLLIANCTLKRQISVDEQLIWEWMVTRIVAGDDCDIANNSCWPTDRPAYKNVAIEVVNELDNCSGRDDWGGDATNCPGKWNYAQPAIQFAHRAGIKATLDDSVCRYDGNLEFRFYNVGADVADFHPCRNDPRTGAPWDPLRAGFDEALDARIANSVERLFDPQFLPRLLVANRGLVVLSETVAYAEDECSGLRTCDMSRIQSYVDRCAANAGCKFTYHSAPWGLAGDTPPVYPIAR